MDIEKLKAEFEQTECFKRLEHVAQYTFFEFGAYIKRTDVPADIEKKCGKLITALLFSWSAWKEAKAQAVPQWISVQDRMPEQGQKVLVFRPDAHNHPHKDPNFKICTYAGADIFINSHFEHVITHWKPLESPIEAQEPAND